MTVKTKKHDVTICSINNTHTKAISMSNLDIIPSTEDMVAFIKEVKSGSATNAMDVAEMYVEISCNHGCDPTIMNNELDTDSLSKPGAYAEIDIMFNRSNSPIDIATTSGMVSLPAGRVIVMHKGVVASNDFHREIHIPIVQSMHVDGKGEEKVEEEVNNDTTAAGMSVEQIGISRTNDIGFVNARDLWVYLEVKTQFTKWIVRKIASLDLEVDVDFIHVVKSDYQVSGTKHLKEYQLTMDSAKEISMTENNNVKSKAIRKYFIRIEKEYSNEKMANKFSLPQTRNEALRALLESYEALEQSKLEAADATTKMHKAQFQVSVDKPKVEYYNTVLDSKDLITPSQVATDLNMTTQALNKRLAALKVIHKKGKVWCLNKKYHDMGLVGVKTYIYDSASADTKHTRNQLTWTQAGREFVLALIKEKGKK